MRGTNTDSVSWIARAGLAAQGASYALVGVLALKLAFGDGGKATDRQSALEVLADESFGRAVIGLIAVGFAAYALWRVIQSVSDREDDGDDASGLAKRAGQLAKAALYAALTVGAVRLVVKGGGGGGSEEQQATGGVLGWPGGRFLVGAVALAVLAAAAWNAYRGLSRKYEKKLDTVDMSDGERAAVGVVAVVGLVARGVVFGVAGWFLLKAAVQFEKKEAVGLGGALARLQGAPYGPVLLGLVAAGLVAFAVFCLAQARYREL